MLETRDPDELRAALGRCRAAGERIGFVPTMGALHAGHLSLVRRARELAGRVVVSIFVNPTQFGPGEDFARYPRKAESDAELLRGAGCDVLFTPETATIYPAGHTTTVEPGGPAVGLEGEMRPGHFRGVATVVCALLNIVRPEVAIFGEKDAQQVAVVKRVVRDLHLGIEIASCPTVRESDGLAMSSRNVFLSAEERRAARVLYQALQAAAREVAGGERRGEAVRRTLREVLATEPAVRIEYAEVVDASTFKPVTELGGQLVLPLAVRIGGTRLIDNLQLAVADEPAAG